MSLGKEHHSITFLLCGSTVVDIFYGHFSKLKKDDTDFFFWLFHQFLI